MSPYRIILILIPVIVCLILHKTYAVDDEYDIHSAKRLKLNSEDYVIAGDDGDDTQSANDGDDIHSDEQSEYKTCISNLIEKFGEDFDNAATKAFDSLKLPQGYNSRDFEQPEVEIQEHSDIQSAGKDPSSSSTFTNQPEVEVPKYTDYWFEYYKLFYASILPVHVQLPKKYCNNLISYYYEEKVIVDLKKYISKIRGQNGIPDDIFFEISKQTDKEENISLNRGQSKIPYDILNANISKQEVIEDLVKYISQIRGHSEILDEEGSTSNDISIYKEKEYNEKLAEKVIEELQTGNNTQKGDQLIEDQLIEEFKRLQTDNNTQKVDQLIEEFKKLQTDNNTQKVDQLIEEFKNEEKKYNEKLAEKIIEDFEKKVIEDIKKKVIEKIIKKRKLKQHKENEAKNHSTIFKFLKPENDAKKNYRKSDYSDVLRKFRNIPPDYYRKEVYFLYKNEVAENAIKDLKKLPTDYYMKHIVREILKKTSAEKAIKDQLKEEYKRCKNFLVVNYKIPNGPPVEIIRHAFYTFVYSEYFPSRYGEGFKYHIRNSFQIYRVLQRKMYKYELSDKHFEGVVWKIDVNGKYVNKGEEFPKHYAPEGTPLMLTYEQFCEERSKQRLINGV